MAAKRTGGLGGRGMNVWFSSKTEGKQNPEKEKQSNKESEKKDSTLESEKKKGKTSSNKENKKPDDMVSVVSISMVEPNKSQPRKKFDEDALEELSESIRQYGILQPLLVSDKTDYYEIIAGERRWRAAKMAGLKEVPVIIKEFSDMETVEISLIENIQREDLNPIEEAMAYKRLMNDFSLKQDEIAEKVSKSRTAVTNSMRLLKLTPKVQQMLIDEMISAGHARALLALPAGELQDNTATRVFDEKLSVRETEKIVKKISENKGNGKQRKVDLTEEALYEHLEEKMKSVLGTKVAIRRRKDNKGKIEIEYYSRDELERIIDLIEMIR